MFKMICKQKNAIDKSGRFKTPNNTMLCIHYIYLHCTHNINITCTCNKHTGKHNANKTLVQRTVFWKWIYNGRFHAATKLIFKLPFWVVFSFDTRHEFCAPPQRVRANTETHRTNLLSNPTEILSSKKNWERERWQRNQVITEEILGFFCERKFCNFRSFFSAYYQHLYLHTLDHGLYFCNHYLGKFCFCLTQSQTSGQTSNNPTPCNMMCVIGSWSNAGHTADYFLQTIW